MLLFPTSLADSLDTVISGGNSCVFGGLQQSWRCCTRPPWPFDLGDCTWRHSHNDDVESLCSRLSIRPTFSLRCSWEIAKPTPGGKNINFTNQPARPISWKLNTLHLTELTLIKYHNNYHLYSLQLRKETGRRGVIRDIFLGRVW